MPVYGKHCQAFTVLNLTSYTFEIICLSKCVCQSYPWHTLCEICVCHGIHGIHGSAAYGHRPTVQKSLKTLWFKTLTICQNSSFQHFKQILCLKSAPGHGLSWHTKFNTTGLVVLDEIGVRPTNRQTDRRTDRRTPCSISGSSMDNQPFRGLIIKD